MLPKIQRVKKELFPIIFKKGRGWRLDFFSLSIFPLAGQKSSFAFIVSNKMAKKAVLRNKIKRRMRAVIAKHLSEIKEGYAAVFVLKSPPGHAAFKDIEDNICQLLKKAKILKT